MTKASYYVVNAITLYRLLMAPVLIVFIFTGQYTLFSWLLPVSFFTDMIDGPMARKYKVASTYGAKLDSWADDINILVALIGLYVFKYEFVREHMAILIILLSLFVLQTLLALIRYKKISSFHTYSAKIAALLQGTFFILLFLLPDPVYILFYAAAILTAIDLVEEIILILLLPEWQSDVKGLYWVLRKKEKAANIASS